MASDNGRNVIYNEATMPLTARHYWIVFVASLGQLVGTAVATVAGIIIPMINILRHPELSSIVQGLIGAADLIGIMIGSIVFGKLSDKYGYLLFFRLCPLLIAVGGVVSILIPTVPVLIVSLFVIGFGIGGEYILDSNYVSELMPTRWSKLMLGVTKTASALGNIIAAAIGFMLIMLWRRAVAWPGLMWIIVGIGVLMFISRIYFFESPKWLYNKGKIQAAKNALHHFLGNNVRLSELYSTQENSISDTEGTAESNRVMKGSGGISQIDSDSGSLGVLSFVKKYFSRVMLSGIPWACEGLGVYGIGVFIPMLVMALGIEHIKSGDLPILHVAESVKTTLWISFIILPGFIIGVWLTGRKINIPRLQSRGFWACAVMLVILLLSYHYGWPKWISLLSFMLFELFLNIGPHLVTYLLPPMIYPVEVRGQGTGYAASLGKLGAVIAVFLIPVLLKAGGAVLVLIVSSAVMALGAIITQIYGPRVMKE